jgi:hypothetical protein
MRLLQHETRRIQKKAISKMKEKGEGAWGEK